MLICLIGPPQSGKQSLQRYLVQQHQFIRVNLESSNSKSPSTSSSSSLSFNSSTQFLDHVTTHWRKDYVTTDLTSKRQLLEFSKRPFVSIVAIDAPVGIRFKRACQLAERNGDEKKKPSLEEFVAKDDLLYHGSLVSSTSDEHDWIPSSMMMEKKESSSTNDNNDKDPTEPPLKVDQTPNPSPTLTRSKPLHHIEQSEPSLSSDPLTSLLPFAHTTLQNPYTTYPPFFSLVDLPTLQLHLRPTWDTYFMALASLASLRSNCMKRRVGAVLVRDKRVVSTGYNGTPRGVRNCNEGGCGRCNSNGDGFGDSYLSKEEERDTSNGSKKDEEEDDHNLRTEQRGGGGQQGQGLDVCVCLHAEENALLEAGRERVSGGNGTESAVLYCNTCPCLTCTVKIVQCGVKEVVYSLSYSMDDASRRVMESAGVVLRQMKEVL